MATSFQEIFLGQPDDLAQPVTPTNAAPLTVENSNGGVDAAQVSGAVSARASFGAVMLDRVEGGVEVDNQNGAVEIRRVSQKSAAGNCNRIAVRTSFGPIRLYLPSDASYAVDARTSMGRVNSEFPVTVTGSVSNGSLAGKIGSGECELRLINGNSSIEILKQAH